MNKRILSLDYIKYQFSKLKRKIYIILTKAVTFIYKKKLPLELLLIMKKNRSFLSGIKEYLPHGEYDDKDNNYCLRFSRQ